MLKRKWIKQILPVIMSISMVFGSMPSTAFAAEETEFLSETGVMQETETAGTDIEYTPAESTVAADFENTTEQEALAESEVTVDTVEENATTQALLDTKIVIRVENIQRYIAEKENALQYDADMDVVLAKYEESDKSVFSNLRAELRDNTQNYNIVSVEVDGKTSTSDTKINNISYQWQKKSGDTYTNLVGEPLEAGDYKLVISLTAIDDVCQAATSELDFTITKRKLFINLENTLTAAPGSTVADFITNLKENYTLRQESRQWNAKTSALSDNVKSIYIASIETNVYDAHDTTKAVLSENTVLRENCDYAVTVKAMLTDAVSPSYVLIDPNDAGIKMKDLIETQVKVTQKNAGEIISKVYEADQPISYETDMKDKVTVSIVVPGKDGDESKDTVIAGALPTLVWCDGNKKELKENTAPTDAGTYYLDFQYLPTEDVQDIYKESKGNYIKVMIEPVPLTLKLSIPEDRKYYTGMTEADVLRDVDYTLFDAAGEAFPIDKNTFWGVSYNNADNTQAYELVFQLIRADKEKDGEVIWTANAPEDTLDASKYAYRLVFTGKKAVYTADGTAAKNDTWDVNGGEVNTTDANYHIVTTKKVLSENYADVPVSEGIASIIDASAIIAAGEAIGCKAAENFNELYQPAHFASKTV